MARSAAAASISLGRRDDVLGLLDGHLFDVHRHAHDVGGLLLGGLLDELGREQGVDDVLGRGILDGDGRRDDLGRLADGGLLDELRLGERLGDLDGGRHLDLLGQLDGLLGLDLDAQLLAHHGERVGRDHGLHEVVPAGCADGVAQVGGPVVLDDQDGRGATGRDGRAELLEAVDATGRRRARPPPGHPAPLPRGHPAGHPRGDR